MYIFISLQKVYKTTFKSMILELYERIGSIDEHYAYLERKILDD